MEKGLAWAEHTLKGLQCLHLDICDAVHVWVAAWLSIMSLQRPYLQIEEMQAVQFVEDVMGQCSEPAAVHVEALEFL